MDMKKIACTVLISAASWSMAFAEVASPTSAPAPAPISGATAGATMSMAVVGASLFSLAAMYLN
ncbi:hypothetical protein NMG60_11003713 [Bertholletia excelsa]